MYVQYIVHHMSPADVRWTALSHTTRERASDWLKAGGRSSGMRRDDHCRKEKVGL
jgi:hypothetical protein